MIQLYIEQTYQDDRLPIDEDALTATIQTALSFFDPNPYELSVILVDAAKSQQLNHTYRHKNKPTNVLSFGQDLPADIAQTLTHYPLGDLVICVPVVLEEAASQNKTPHAHLTHLCVHGLLHLLGYDHEHDQEAAEMEALEIEILHKLGIDNPYKDDEC